MTNAVQKDDIRQLIEEGVIKARPLVGNSRGRARKAEAQKPRGVGRDMVPERGLQTRGTQKAQVDEDHPRSTKGVERNAHDSTLTPSQYRLFYRKAKGGSIGPLHT